MSEKPELTEDEKVAVAFLDQTIALLDLEVALNRLVKAGQVIANYNNKANEVDNENRD